MPPRHHPTLADYVALAVGPVLIMLLIGSLVSFLLEVFYQGSYQTRLQVILAMFVTGAVCVGRISIEEGREYSILYALPLAGVTALAAWRFVRFEGPLSEWSLLICIGLIGFIMWCADRLTWDCTVIGQGQDGQGEGLLQTVGLDGPTTGNPSAGSEFEASADADRPEVPVWQRFLEYRRRPHAPGVWVIYFSLAALPVFGIGQLWIRSTDLESRRYVFQLLVVYVGSALGLLLTTSFLSLRRYLGQRDIEMPGEVVRRWLAVGVSTIVLILTFCLLLPRRNPEYSVTHLPFLATSPDDLSTSPWALGHDGPQDPAKADRPAGQRTDPVADEQDRSQPNPLSRQAGSPDPSASAQAAGGRAESGGQPTAGQPTARRPASGPGKGEQTQGGPPQEGQPPTGPQAKANSRQQTPPRDSPRRDRQGDGSPPNNGPNNASRANPPRPPSQAESLNPPRDQQEHRNSTKHPTEHQDHGDSQADGAEARPSPGRRAPSRQDDQRSSGPPPQSPPREPRSDAQLDPADRDPEASEAGTEDQRVAGERAAEDPGRGADGTTRRSPSPPAQLLRGLGSRLGTLIQWIYWVIAVAVMAFLLWRNWPHVVRALRNFSAAVGRLWRHWFGGRDAVAAQPPFAAGPLPSPARPFADFRNPFAAGVEDKYSADDLIRYTFEAFEAWGREQGCPRSAEQTPHEFAIAATRHARRLTKPATRLAELYNWAAYARDELPASYLDQLRHFWRQLS